MANGPFVNHMKAWRRCVVLMIAQSGAPPSLDRRLALTGEPSGLLCLCDLPGSARNAHHTSMCCRHGPKGISRQSCQRCYAASSLFPGAIGGRKPTQPTWHLVRNRG